MSGTADSSDQKIKEEVQTLRSQMEVAKKELEKLERIKPLASVASSVVHDIRNSLGIISSTAQFVLSKQKPQERERQAWELVERNVESINKILKGYLGLARQVENIKEPFSLNDLVNRICRFIENQSRKQNIKLEKSLDPSVPALMIEVAAIESSILNIALNAMEAMEHDGAITFTTRKDDAGKKVVLEIQDSGPGMPQEVLDKLFIPFFTTKKTGTGMGLYSAKVSIENNDGKISCESRAGSGTKMILSFPLNNSSSS